MMKNYLRVLIPFIFFFGLFSCQVHSKTIGPQTTCQAVAPPLPFEFAATPDIKFLQPIVNSERLVLLLRDASGVTQAVMARNLRPEPETKEHKSVQVFLLVHRKRSLKVEEANGQVIVIKDGRIVKFVEEKYFVTVPEDKTDYYKFHNGNRITAELSKDLKLMEEAWGFSKPIVKNMCEDFFELSKKSLKSKSGGTNIIGTTTGLVLCFIYDEWCKQLNDIFYDNGVDWDWTSPDPDIDTDSWYPDDRDNFDTGGSQVGFVCTLDAGHCKRGVIGQGLGQPTRDAALNAAKDSARTACGGTREPVWQEEQCGSYTVGSIKYHSCCVTACCKEEPDPGLDMRR